MTTVTLKMYDELNQKNVERTIDGSNIMVADTNALPGMECNKIGNDQQIKEKLDQWINERANKQHNTILSLINYKINNFKL